jgi:hypothetical protein
MEMTNTGNKRMGNSLMKEVRMGGVMSGGRSMVVRFRSSRTAEMSTERKNGPVATNSHLMAVDNGAMEATIMHETIMVDSKFMAEDMSSQKGTAETTRTDREAIADMDSPKMAMVMMSTTGDNGR